MSEHTEVCPEARRAARRSRMRRVRRAIARPLVRWVAPAMLRLLAWTWRTECYGHENMERAKSESRGGGHFIALWHGRMILSMPDHRDSNWQVLVSPSGDGDLSESLLYSFGYQVIRGSSSRGGARALREMLSHLRQGHILVITPDGPRGPRHSMNPGLAWMARATGHPIVPSGCVCDRAWRVNSWDRMTIPKPFARVRFYYLEPIWVARDATDEDMQAATDRVRDAMIEAETEGFARLGVERDW